jgi:hypothetical protein
MLPTSTRTNAAKEHQIMSIYRPKRGNYRKIYENHFGSIPKDEDGRTYDIHHIDGNHNNNDISNLIAVSITEHFKIHESQNDWGICLSMLKRMKVDPKVRTEIARKHALKQLANGTHNFLNPATRHNYPKGELHPIHKRTKNGENPFSKERSSHNWKVTCLYCKKAFGYPVFQSRHGEKCTENPTSTTKHIQKKIGCIFCKEVVWNYIFEQSHGEKCRLNPERFLCDNPEKFNPNNIMISCLKCKKVLGFPLFKKYHGEKCKGAK